MQLTAMVLDECVIQSLPLLAGWVLASGIDDLFLNLAWGVGRLTGRLGTGFRWPDEAELDSAPQRRIAVFLPLWQEHRVLERMLDHNIAANRYGAYEFFIGAYPNDPDTIAAVRHAQERFANVHLTVCPHDGPTSKADCLNWIYQGMSIAEKQSGQRFEIIVTHDAEDLIHPDALRLLNYWSREYDMVQIPVLPLPTGIAECTHGLYCDEFAEYQIKDIPVRQMLGGFIASNGVGTGFSRAALEKLAAHGERVFDPECLTEDYANGFRIHAMRCPQLFVPLRRDEGGVVATREYFPRDFRAAVRQRTRWITGISLQCWERYGWSAPLRQRYWLWRDRKGLIGNLVTLLCNLVFLYGVIRWRNLENRITPALAWVCTATLCLSASQILFRACSAARFYGWRFAAGVPLRAIWGNWLNGIATLRAMQQYFAARLAKRPLRWVKTEHIYPSSEVLRLSGQGPAGEAQRIPPDRAPRPSTSAPAAPLSPSLARAAAAGGRSPASR